MGSRRSWISLAAAATLALLILLFWLVRAGSGSPAASAPTASRAVTAVHTPSPSVQGFPDEETAPIVIDAIEVEKQELCAGEENLITVKAHTRSPEDAPQLQIAIEGHEGAQVALRPRAYLRPDGMPPQVVAYLADGRRAVADVPVFDVRDCKPDRALTVQHRPVPSAHERYELWARVYESAGRDGAAAGFHPVRYRWDLSDGSSKITDSPIVEIDFMQREQTTMVSHILVTCTAEAADGSRLVARDNIVLRNHAYEHLVQRGVVLLEVDQPRFPEADEHGVVTSPVRIWHRHTSPVTVTDVEVVRVFRGPPQKGGVHEKREHVAPSALLGTDRIPASGVQRTLNLDTRAEPDTSFILYRLIGRTDDGLRAFGDFSVMRPTDLPTRENSVPVSDSRLMAKIMAAQKILGKQYVTDEDIWRLEREGKLDDAQLDRAVLAKRMPDAPQPPR